MPPNAITGNLYIMRRLGVKMNVKIFDLHVDAIAAVYCPSSVGLGRSRYQRDSLPCPYYTATLPENQFPRRNWSWCSN